MRLRVGKGVNVGEFNDGYRWDVAADVVLVTMASCELTRESGDGLVKEGHGWRRSSCDQVRVGKLQHPGFGLKQDEQGPCLAKARSTWLLRTFVASHFSESMFGD